MKNSLAGSPWLFSDGLAAVLIKNKWGYIDRQGHVAIAPQYTAASGFSEGLAAVEVNNKYGFIDRYGKMVIKPKYDFALAFTEGVAACSIGGGYHIIDRNGKVLAELGEDCTDVENFSCGLAAAEFNVGDGDWRYGAIDKTGKMVIKPKFSFAYTFEEDLMPVVVNDGDKCGFVNKEGKCVIAPEFDETESFSEGLAPAMKDGKWRFIDHEGHDHRQDWRQKRCHRQGRQPHYRCSFRQSALLLRRSCLRPYRRHARLHQPLRNLRDTEARDQGNPN